MFQKNPICLKNRPICCPYVVLSERFSSPYVEKAPYVANQVPICGPYAAHMWPICFGCSSACGRYELQRLKTKKKKAGRIFQQYL